MDETLTILRVKTDGVESIADLKDNVKQLKTYLDQATIGTDEYKEALDLLKVNQNALKDAMYATTGKLKDVTDAAAGASDSYNSLVHRMAALKEEFRATNDAARRMELGQQIKAINDQLKDMDALQGNFQRNVGNYANSVKDAFKDMSVNADVFRKSLKSVGGGLNGFKDGLEGISKSPAIATIGILVSLVAKLVSEMKENDKAMAAFKKGMDALKPVMDFFSGILDSVAETLSEIITKVVQFVTSNGVFQKVINGLVGVGNAIVKFVIAPFKAVIEAIKVFKEQGIAGFRDAAKAFGNEMKGGVAFKANYEAGVAMGDAIIAGAASRKKKANDTGKALGKSIEEGLKEALAEIDKSIEADLASIDKEAQEALDKALKAEEEANKKAQEISDKRLKGIDKYAALRKEKNDILEEDEKKRLARDYAIQEEADKKKLSLLDQYMQDALDRNDLDAYLKYDQQRADLEVQIEMNALKEKERLRKQELKEAEENAKKRMDLMNGVASATSSILGGIADLYEADEKNSEKNANKIKALRIAEATVNTISGAIGAYMQAVKNLPAPAGAIVGAIQAAAVTATGLANIAKLKSTNVTGDGAASATPTMTTASAPTLQTRVSNVRSVTSASEEDRLNRMASDQRVYILSSDIEASQHQIKTQVAESSF